MGFDLRKIRARLERIPKQFTGKVAQIGLPRGANYEDGTPVAYVGAIQEFGAPEVGIPPRPFFRPAVQAHAPQWAALIRHLLPRVSTGELTAAEVLDGAGAAAAADIQATIATVYSPALSPVTVLLRKWRKEGRKISGRTVGQAARAIKEGENPGSDDKPLNDTGYLIASIASGVGSADGEDFTK